MSDHLIVNPILCDGRGTCADLFPEAIVLDDWGYPIVRRDALPAHFSAVAAKACAMCPTGALSIQPRDPRSHSVQTRKAKG